MQNFDKFFKAIFTPKTNIVMRTFFDHNKKVMFKILKKIFKLKNKLT